MCVCVCVCVQWVWPREWRGCCDTFLCMKDNSVFHPGKFNGVMEVAAIQMGGVYIRYTP